MPRNYVIFNVEKYILTHLTDLRQAVKLVEMRRTKSNFLRWKISVIKSSDIKLTSLKSDDHFMSALRFLYWVENVLVNLKALFQL